MSRTMSPAMQAAMQRTQSVAQDIKQIQQARPPVQYVSVVNLTPSPFQARLDFAGLESLAEDIRANGVLQPLLARKTAAGLELIAGERRWRAAQLAGLAEVPVVIREATDEQARLYNLKENLERQDLNAFEVASVALDLVALAVNTSPLDARARLVARGSQDVEVELALEDALRILGRDLTRLSFTKHYLPLLDLPEHLRDAIRRGASFNAVRLLRRATAEQQAEWLPLIESGTWGVRDIEAALQATPRPTTSRSELAEETRRILRLASPKRLDHLSAQQKDELKALLQQVSALLN